VDLADLMELAERISYQLDTESCVHPERAWCVDCMVADVLIVVGPLLADSTTAVTASEAARAGQFPSAEAATDV
jgi:hypothetical protein